MGGNVYNMNSKILVYPGMGGWRFLILPKNRSKEIKAKYGANSRGWGSIPVSVRVGKTTWKTSIFPDKKSGTYLLPLKAKVRKSENISDESSVKFSISL